MSQGATTDISRVVREPVVSRSDSRLASVRGERVILQMQDAYDARKTRQAIENAHVHVWTTAPLNLWTTPDQDAKQVGLLDSGKKVLVTGRRAGERAELVVDGKSRWVTAGYLTEDKPVVQKAAVERLDPRPARPHRRRPASRRRPAPTAASRAA